MPLDSYVMFYDYEYHPNHFVIIFLNQALMCIIFNTVNKTDYCRPHTKRHSTIEPQIEMMRPFLHVVIRIHRHLFFIFI